MTIDTTAVPVLCAELSRDGLYFFDLVTFKVENCLFRVPKQRFQEQSHVFRDMFALPLRDDGTKSEGTSDENPIVLDGVNEHAFRLLLSQVYLLGFQTDLEDPMSLGDCLSLLDLSHMWGFDQIRKSSTSTIRKVWWNGMDPVKKVELTHKYEVEEWRVTAYEELAVRSQPLTVDEARRFGVDFTALIAQVRERMIRARCSSCKICNKSHSRLPAFALVEMENNVHNAVKEVFGL